MIVHDTRMKTQSNVETMIEWKGNSTGVSKKVCNCVTSTGLRKNWTGGTEVRWVNTSWKELRGEGRWEESWGESRRCAQKWRSLKRVDERWEAVGSVEKWFRDLRQEVRSPGKEHGSLPQLQANLFLDPIASHFLNLETSATRLARVLLVKMIRKSVCVSVSVCVCVCIFACIFAQVAKQNCGSDGASCGKGKKILYIRIYDMYIYIYHTCALKPAITSHNQPNVHPSIPAAKNSSTPIGSCSSVGHRKRRSELMASQLITLRSKSWQGRGCCYQLLPAELRIDNIMIPNPDFVAKSMGCDQLKLRLNQKIFGIHSEARASLSLFKQTTWEFHKKMGSGPPATTSGRVKS